ncbi:hypothetical protein J4217_03190 [Candidatus Pacearchaeota archaeon]|nr:hypothetical protein [Candidatus Pacearchaeota archaeon]
MVNKKGWIRILEASIAIIIIFGVLAFMVQEKKINNGKDLSQELPTLLDEIANNNILREKIVTTADVAGVEAEIEDFLATKLTNPNIKYKVKICEMDNTPCPLVPYPTTIDNEVYTKERTISSVLTKIAPRRVKIFMWQETS